MEMASVLIPALYLLSGACAQQWAVTFAPQPLVGWRGSCLTIPCSFRYPAGQTVIAVKWMFRETIVYDSDEGRVHADFKGCARYLGDLRNNCSLLLAWLCLSDQGTYYFRFVTDKDKWTSRTGQQLSVSDPQCQPSMESQKEPQHSLACSVRSPCSLHPSWYDADGTRRIPEQTAGKAGMTELLISPSRLPHGMTLKCQVDGYRDRCDSDQSQPLRPDMPSIKVLQPTGKMAIKEGERFKLHCQAAALRPVIRYVWSHGDMWLPADEKELLIDKANVSDGGNYSCGVWVSGLGWAYLSLSAKESIKVQHAPKDVNITAIPTTVLHKGDSMNLTCHFSSSVPTAVTYAWYRNNASLGVSQEVLMLQNVTATNSGEYHCEVKNQVGLARSPPLNLTIQDAPKGVNITAMPTTVLHKGDSVNLTCHFSSGVPTAVTYAWYRNNASLGVSQEVLVLQDVTAMNTGEYHCEVQNQVGLARSPPLNLTIQVTPSVWPSVNAIGGAAAAVSLLLVGLAVIIAWSNRRRKYQGKDNNPSQPGPGEAPTSECIYENTQHRGTSSPSTEQCQELSADRDQSCIYSQLNINDKAPQANPDEVCYSTVQFHHSTQRVEPDHDTACEYAAIKR